MPSLLLLNVDSQYCNGNVPQVFELEYFRENPEPFWAVTKELFYQAAESKPHPTPGHAFLRLLQDKGYLRRVYTQVRVRALGGYASGPLLRVPRRFLYDPSSNLATYWLYVLARNPNPKPDT